MALREGDDLEAAIEAGFEEPTLLHVLDRTKDELALVRDPFACSPPWQPRTDDYVAIASEFRSLGLPARYNDADVFEPGPEEIFVWNRSP